MLPEELNLALKKYNKKVFIYEWEYFTKRIQDELLFSALEEYQFLYVEISFNATKNELQKKEDSLKFWKAFLNQLTQKRYNDLCGFLEDNKGIALIFSHSNSQDNVIAWLRFCQDISSETGFDMQKWNEIVYAEYPPREFFAKS
ncbi:MAG: hypothetical protein LBH25_05845 [Fibromonadaceae bacterium]|jgi:hypothetical protein|nr:hypothetical protein [Fibromonadaceae bacterium]